MELKDLLDLTQNQRLEEIERKKTDLELMIANQTLLPEVRSVYELALDQLKSAIEAATQTPEIQEGYAMYGIEGIDGLTQIEPLKGILPDDQIEPVVNSLQARIMTSREFYEKYGAHSPGALEFVQKAIGGVATGAVAEPIPIPDPNKAAAAEQEPETITAQAETTGEVIKKNIAIRVRQNTVQMGRQGKIVPLSTKQAHYRDYSEMRLAALEYIVDNQQREITPYEIWSAISSEDFNRDAFTHVQKWLRSLTYNRKGIICSNGKRSTASRYFVEPSFSLTITHAEERNETVTQRDSESLIAGDAYIAARHLQQFNPILADHDCPIIEEDLVSSLERHQPDYSGIKGNTDAIWQARQAALERAENFLSNEDAFFTFLQTVGESTPEYKFLEYLFDLEAEQRELLKRLMSAKIKRDVIDVGRIRFWAVNAHDKDDIIAFSEVVERQPTLIGQMVDKSVEPVADTTTDSEEAVDMPEDKLIIIPKEASAHPVSERVSRRSVSATEWNDRERNLFESLKTTSLGHAEAFVAQFDPSETYKSAVLSSVFAKFNAKNIASARDNGIIARVKRNLFEKKYSIEETIRVLAYTENDLRHLLKTRKYKTRAAELIRESIQEAIRAHQAESAAKAAR